MIFSAFEWHAILLSLKVSFFAILFSLPAGVIVAWLLARKTFWGKTLLDNLVHLPLILPPVVIGYLLLISMGKKGVIGHYFYDWFGINFSFDWKGAALASAVVAFPLMVRAIRQSIEAIDMRLENVAKTLGATTWRVFFTITLPLSLPGIIIGCVLAFARSMGEFGATITFVANVPEHTQTIPLAMYTLLEMPHSDFAATRLCLVAIVISFFALFISEKVNHYYQQKRQ